MTNTIFAKFCKDTKGILSKKSFTLPQIDMVWTKVAGKAKTIAFKQFLEMLNEIAAIKKIDPETFVAKVVQRARIKSHATKAESKFYDDKSKWTGVAVQGGPDSSAPKTGLAALANRSNKADVRGNVV